MPAEFNAVFAMLKPVLAKYAARLSVKTDTSIEYTLVTKSASPFPQHKGQPMFFGSVRPGKAYVSFHLMPLYMCPPLTKSISPELGIPLTHQTPTCCVAGCADLEPPIRVS
jgi:hypothetical protein